MIVDIQSNKDRYGKTSALEAFRRLFTYEESRHHRFGSAMRQMYDKLVPLVLEPITVTTLCTFVRCEIVG